MKRGAGVRTFGKAGGLIREPLKTGIVSLSKWLLFI